ncbi:AEC family transporter [Desulfobaculum sp. SPO524]|uniref:AEC family transporter n=1 Tax=Desulfobaculum sp. SPO524 TaxID=3378071 RepID=UPI0038523C1B
MFHIVVASLLPLFAMIIAGWYAQRRGILGEGSATALNDFVYYFSLPALMFVSLATTPIEEIFQFRFIAGFTLAMFASYVLMFFVSSLFFKTHRTISCLRSTSASFPNCGYLGFPIMLSLFHGSRTAFVTSTLGVLLPTLIVMIVVAEFEFHRAGGRRNTLSIAGQVVCTMVKTPIILASFCGVAASYFDLGMPDYAAQGLKSFGMASVPCALFAVGMLMARLERNLRLGSVLSVNVVKIIVQPLLALGFLLLFDVSGELLVMGVLLAGMPTAAVACILSQVYETCEMETSATVLVSMLLYVPAFALTLLVAEGMGVAIG